MIRPPQVQDAADGLTGALRASYAPPPPHLYSAGHGGGLMRPVGEGGPLDISSEICETLFYQNDRRRVPPCPPATQRTHASIRCLRWTHGGHIGLKCVRVCFMWTYVSNVGPVGRVLLGVSGSVFVSVPLWQLLAPCVLLGTHSCPYGTRACHDDIKSTFGTRPDPKHLSGSGCVRRAHRASEGIPWIPGESRETVKPRERPSV